jgi:hypothetical protein
MRKVAMLQGRLHLWATNAAHSRKLASVDTELDTDLFGSGV